MIDILLSTICTLAVVVFFFVQRHRTRHGLRNPHGVATDLLQLCAFTVAMFVVMLVLGALIELL